MKGLKNNKSQGSDGYANEFYKNLKEDMRPILERAYAYAFEKGNSHKIGKNWKETIILVIHKDSKALKCTVLMNPWPIKIVIVKY